MVLVPLVSLSWLSWPALIREHHVSARSVTRVHQVTLNMHVRCSHLLVIVHHGRALHSWVWLTLRRHSSWTLMLLPVLLLLVSLHKLMLSSWGSLRRRSSLNHLLHHHLIHAWHLHGHVLVLGLVVWVSSSLLLRAHWSVGHHVSRLLLRSAGLGLGLLHVLHFQTLFTY